MTLLLTLAINLSMWSLRKLTLCEGHRVDTGQSGVRIATVRFKDFRASRQLQLAEDRIVAGGVNGRMGRKQNLNEMNQAPALSKGTLIWNQFHPISQLMTRGQFYGICVFIGGAKKQKHFNEINDLQPSGKTHLYRF